MWLILKKFGINLRVLNRFQLKKKKSLTKSKKVGKIWKNLEKKNLEVVKRLNQSWNSLELVQKSVGACLEDS